MLSRVANALFWLGRYLERAENAARFLAVTYTYAQELRSVSHAAADDCWSVVWRLMGADPPEGAAGNLHSLILDESFPGSVVCCVGWARENARGIRDAIASEMWEAINVLHLRLQEETDPQRSHRQPLPVLHRVMDASFLFQGLRDSTMVRSDEWHFLCLGQHLERADMMLRILDAMFDHPAVRTAAESGQEIDTLHLVATLRSCTAFEAYSRALHALTPEGVANFLLLDSRFPRSAAFCVREVERSLHALSGTREEHFSNDAEQICGRLVAELRFAAIEEVMADGFNPHLLQLRGKVGQLGAAVSDLYFP